MQESKLIESRGHPFKALTNNNDKNVIIKIILIIIIKMK